MKFLPTRALSIRAEHSMRVRGAVVAALATLVTVLAVVFGIQAALAGGVKPVSANVTGTGKVIANGKAAWVDFVIRCPKGQTWSIGADTGFNFVSVDGDQAPGGLVPTSGKCQGTSQFVKVKFVPRFTRVGPGCGDYSMTMTVAGQEIGLNWAPGVDEVTGPPVCLTSNSGSKADTPEPSPTPTAVPS